MKKIRMEPHLVSNEHRELKRVAKKMGCMPSDVLRAKEQTGSRRRVVVEDWLKQNVVNNEQHERNLP